MLFAGHQPCRPKVNQINVIYSPCGESDVTHRTSWIESTGECIGQHMTFGLNATMVQNSKEILLFPNLSVYWAIKLKVLLVLHSLHVTVLANAFVP